MKRFIIDPGFGHTKIAIGDEYSKFPSAVAEIGGISNSNDSKVFHFEGKKYYVGDLALMQPASDIIEINTFDLLKYFAPLFVGYQMINSGTKNENISDLIFCLSPAHKDRMGEFKDRLKSFKVNDQEFKFDDVIAMAQGAASWRAINKITDLDSFDNFLIVDIGFNTIDVIFIYNREIQSAMIGPENSYENCGSVNIANAVISLIKEKHGSDISQKEALEIFDKKCYKKRGEVFDYKKEFAKISADFTKNTMNLLEKKYSNELDKMDKVCFTGGGGYFIDPNYSKNILTFENSEYLNIIGASSV